MTRTMNVFAKYSKQAMGLTEFLLVACVAGRNNGIFANVLSPKAHHAFQAGQGNGPSPVDLGAAGSFVILAETRITTGASVNGRLLAQTNVTMIMNTVAEPAP